MAFSCTINSTVWYMARILEWSYWEREYFHEGSSVYFCFSLKFFNYVCSSGNHVDHHNQYFLLHVVQQINTHNQKGKIFTWNISDHCEGYFQMPACISKPFSFNKTNWTQLEKTKPGNKELGEQERTWGRWQQMTAWSLPARIAAGTTQLKIQLGHQWVLAEGKRKVPLRC